MLNFIVILSFLAIGCIVLAPSIFAPIVKQAFGVLLFVCYFLPTIIAFSRDHVNALAIFLTNLFFGWSVIGWIISLIWSVYN